MTKNLSLYILQIGRLLRFIGYIKNVVTRLHSSLKFVTSGALLVIFWVKVSQAAEKGDLQKFSPLITFAVTAFGTAVITSFLIFTFLLSALLRLPKKSILPLTVLSSARNSSIAIAVIENLPPNVGDKDLMFFPIIFVYLSMVVIINCFGAFMKIKEKEVNDIEQDADTVGSKPLHEAQTEKLLERNVEVATFTPQLTTERSSLEENGDIALPFIQRCTAV